MQFEGDRAGTRGFWLAAIALLILARAFLIPVRVFDADEFEHTHAAWSVFKGLVPYRDFFEHHGPLTYVLGLPAAWLVGPRPELLLAFRWLSVGCVLATLPAVARLAGRGRWSAWLWLLLPKWSYSTVRAKPSFAPRAPARAWKLFRWRGAKPH